MKKVYFILIVGILFNCPISGQEGNPDIIIAKDTTIGVGIDSIGSNLIVNENATLTILPGAILYFKKPDCSGCGYKIIVKGNIKAKGTADNPIVFTSIDSTSASGGFWGVSIEKPVQSGDTVWFDQCIFENSDFSGYSNGVISVNEFSNVKITHSRISNNSNLGIYNTGFLLTENITIYGGRFEGIRNSGTAKVSNTSIYNNYGGGIYNQGNLLVTNSTVYHNQAHSGTNGADGLPGRCDCYSSTNGTNGLMGGNGDNGGGIYNSGIAEIINSTITRNYSGNYGKGGSGGAGANGTCTKVDPITHQITTTYCFSASGSKGANGHYGNGGGIYNTGVLTLKNSVVAYNKKCDYSSDEIWGTVASSSYNIIMDKSGAAFTSEAGNLYVDPLIDLLQNNGGNTPTCALQLGSPAIDALPNGLSDAPVFDQRGSARLGNPDIGSYEFTGCVLNEMKAAWNPSPIGQDSWIYDISVVNDSIAWAKDGNADSISISTNGGLTWLTKPLPKYEGFPRPAGGICALSETQAYYIVSVSDSKGIYKTSDGGDTWVKQSTGFNQNSPFPDIVHFWNGNDGVAFGDADPNQNFEIYTTTNGGVLWNRVPDGNMPDGNKEATSNGQSTYRVVGNSIFFITNTARIFKSLDKGITWSVINTPFYNTPQANSIITFDFKDNNNGLVSYCSNDQSNYKIYRTIDGGQTWESVPTHSFYQQMRYIPAVGAYFSLNQNGGLSYSCDDGQTWVSVPYFNLVKLLSASYSPGGRIFFGGLANIYTSSKYLFASASVLAIAAPANSTKTFDLVSNTDWAATSNQTWLAVDKTSGSGNATITLTAQANPATTTRAATVTITGTGVAAQTITVTQDGKTSGVANITEMDFAIYPNPVSQVLYFNSKSEKVSATVFNLNGQVVLTKQIKENKINVSGLPNGFYTIRIVDGSGVSTKKFVKQ